MDSVNVYVKILKWGIIVSLFLPLVIFAQYISPFHFGKMIIFRSLVEIMAVFYIILAIISKEYRPKWTPLVITFSIFVGLYFLTGIIGVDFYNSFWGSLERMGGIFSLLHFWVYFIILVSIIQSQKDWLKILKISVFVGFLSILFGYGQHFKLGNFFVGWQHGERIIGTIGNPALFAGYLLFIIFLAILFLLHKETSLKEKGFFAAVVILGIPVLLITAVRGAMIAFFGSLFVLALFFIFKSDKKKVKMFLVGLILIFLIFAAMVWMNKSQPWVKNIGWLSRLTDISADTSTVQTRLWSWKSGIEGWKEKPIFGWGPENFVYLHMKYFDARHFTHIGSETIWDRAHNMVLEELSTMGVIGLVSYLSIFGVVFYLLWKNFKRNRIDKITFGVLSAMLIAYFGQNLFIFDTFANYFLFFLSLGYINFLSFRSEDSDSDNVQKEENTAQKTPSPFLIMILLIIAGILAYQTNIKPAMANFACTRAIIAGQGGDASKALSKYQEALKYNSPQGAYEIRHKLAAFLIQVVDSMRQKNKDFDSSLLFYGIKEIDKNIEKYPLDTTPYLYKGRMYILLIGKEANVGEKAEAAIQKAIDLNPNNPRIWYEMGQAQLSQKKNQVSYDSFKRAVDLNANVTTSWWFLGMVAYQLGNYQEAVLDVEKAMNLGYDSYKNSISDIMRLVNIYEKVGNYQKVLQYYLMATAEQPQNPQLFASLAAVYANLGDYDNAVKAAERAIEIDPSFKEEAEKFIESLKR